MDVIFEFVENSFSEIPSNDPETLHHLQCLVPDDCRDALTEAGKKAGRGGVHLYYIEEKLNDKAFVYGAYGQELETSIPFGREYFWRFGIIGQCNTRKKRI